MRGLAAVTLVVSQVCAASAVSAWQALPPIPPKPGAAAGTVQAGDLVVKLTHAYVGLQEDGLYQVVLTDAPLPAAAVLVEVKSRGGQRLLRTGQVSGISMLVDDKGFIRNIIPFIGRDLRGGNMLASAGSLASLTASPASMTGQGSATPDQTGVAKWSYAASWNAVPVAVR